MQMGTSIYYSQQVWTGRLRRPVQTWFLPWGLVPPVKVEQRVEPSPSGVLLSRPAMITLATTL